MLGTPCVIKLTLYGRTYCHLCDDMIAGLRAMQAGARFELEIIDVDSDAALEARYGEWVPVLVGADGELCHYHLDVAKVNDYLRKIG
ncbi:MAG: glutaredoxin family protein [Betaproteobacteria bacterium]|nr:glutaredoxin family protein [Betaproteobacteria bacterium]